MSLELTTSNGAALGGVGSIRDSIGVRSGDELSRKGDDVGINGIIGSSPTGKARVGTKRFLSQGNTSWTLVGFDERVMALYSWATDWGMAGGV